jgi:hypothetical protein
MYGLGSLGLASKWYHSLGLIVRLREDSRGVMWTSSFKERFGFGPWWACVSRVTSYYCVCGWPNGSFLSLLLINFLSLLSLLLISSFEFFWRILRLSLE